MANSTTVNGGIVVTVPANSNWLGSILLSASATVPIGGAAVATIPTVTVSGSGGNMKDGDTMAAVALAMPAVSVTALTGQQVASSMSTGFVNVQARATPVSLILNFAPGVTAVAVAAGAVQ